MSSNTHSVVAMGDLTGLSRISATLIRPSKEDSHTKDEKQLKRAQLEKLYSERILSKKAIIVDGAHGEPEVLELSKLHKQTTVRQALLEQVLAGDHGATETGQLLRKIRERFDKAGVPINDVLVRWRNLSITGQVEIKTNKSPHITEQIKDGFKLVKSLVTGRPAGDVREMQILDGVSGVLKPGRFTVLLGPPGSGKSCLMKALAGQLTKDKSLQVSYDELTYNGLSLGEFVAERTAAYVSQVDQHFGELTVRETFDFSARCQMSQTRKTTLELLEEKEKELGITPDPALAAYLTALQKAGRQNMITDLVIKTLGLDICAETVVGNNMLRGISGGQKKRVTTGEMMVGPMKVLFADEISTGLDSATTYDICKSLRASCHVMQATMLVSLLQPAPETYDLFDDVMVMSSGKLVFHGPREFVVPFFSGLGFACPRMKGVADFLQEVNTLSDQERFWTGPPDAYRYIPAGEIADAFYATEAGAAAVGELKKPASSEVGCHAELAKHRYGQSWPSLFRANLRRQVILQQRTIAFAIIRIFQCIVMGFATGTLFLNQNKLNLQDAQLFMSVGFFSVLFQLVGAFPASAILIDRLPVYYKQRDAHFYPAWCFALPELILQLPLMLAESWIWTLMVYFMVGFYTSARLLVFWGFMLTTSVWGLSLFMALSCISRSHAVATAVQSFAMLIFLVASGFIANAADMPGGWIGAFYSNPIAYFIKGLVINEMTSPDWSQPAPEAPSLSLGELALVNRGYPTEYYHVWIGLFAVGLGSTFINLVLFVWAATYLSALKGTRAVSEEVVMERSLSKGGSLDKMVTMRKTAKLQANCHGDVEEGGDGGNGKVQSALPFKPLVVTFKDVYYSVPLPKGSTMATCDAGPHSGQLLLLKNISGVFRPGVLTALMGASGAGKTTLMDVLAGRKTGGKTTGDIMVNGYPQQLKTFNRVVGYVEQNDVHIPEATIQEALLLSARLRLPSDVPLDVKEKFVEEVLDLVELAGIRHAQIGTPGLTGLSVEQRKRLTIAVELVANPSIVFMDEPTSGLDARAASFVMRAVRNTVNTGRTVVCTIHQPSLDIFLAFDELLLLKRGGETVFNGAMGPEAVNLINYFSAVPGVPPIKASYNPSNWMLEVTAPDAEAAIGVDFAERFQKSELAQSTAALIDSLSQPKEGVADLTYGDMNVTSFWFQTRELLGRNFQQYARKYDYNVTRMVITFVIGMCFGTLFMNQGSATDTFNGVVNIAGALYMSVLFLGIIDCFMVQDVIFVRRNVFYRENAAGMYGVGPYIAAEALVEVPYVVVQSVVYSLLVYWMIGFQANAAKFFWFFFIMILSLLYWVLFGMFNVHVTPNPELAQALSGFSFGFVNLFCGFLKPRPAIPAGWIWMYWINPLSYTLYALVVGQLGDINTPMESTGGGAESQTVSEFIESFLGYEWGFRWWCVLIIVGYIFLFFAVSTLALKKLKWQSR